MAKVLNAPLPGHRSMTPHSEKPEPGNVPAPRISMRGWASNSYSSTTGRAASALEADGNSNRGYTNATSVSNQIDQVHARGQHNAPSFDERTARCVQQHRGRLSPRGE
jgi:hypothetical protein